MFDSETTSYQYHRTVVKPFIIIFIVLTSQSYTTQTVNICSILINTGLVILILVSLKRLKMKSLPTFPVPFK